jgi:hypothetical protein
MAPPECRPGQLAYTFLIHILSTSLTSVSIFSVCCYSSVSISLATPTTATHTNICRQDKKGQSTTAEQIHQHLQYAEQIHVCADGFQGLLKAVYFPIQLLTFFFFEITYF